MSGGVECFLAVAVVDLLHHLSDQFLVLLLRLLHCSDRALELVDSLLHVLILLFHRVLELLGLKIFSLYRFVGFLVQTNLPSFCSS